MAKQLKQFDGIELTVGRFLLKDLYKLWNLHDPNMRGQVCWSMGKFFRIIGHFAFTVSLDDSTVMIVRNKGSGNLIEYVMSPFSDILSSLLGLVIAWR